MVHSESLIEFVAISHKPPIKVIWIHFTIILYQNMDQIRSNFMKLSHAHMCFINTFIVVFIALVCNMRYICPSLSTS